MVDVEVRMCRVAPHRRPLVNSTPRYSHELAIGPTLRPSYHPLKVWLATCLSYHSFHKSPGILFMHELAQCGPPFSVASSSPR